MVRIAQTSSYEEELNKVGMFNLQKRKLTENMVVILQKRKQTYFANIPIGKTRSNG